NHLGGVGGRGVGEPVALPAALIQTFRPGVSACDYNMPMIRPFIPLCLLASALSAGGVRVDIQSRTDLLGGKAFGLAGPYEKLSGKIYFAVDPANPRNQIIADIAKAPRNDKGLVEFSADVMILKPKRMDRGNGAVLYEVSNRGGKGMLAFFNR